MSKKVSLKEIFFGIPDNPNKNYIGYIAEYWRLDPKHNRINRLGFFFNNLMISGIPLILVPLFYNGIKSNILLLTVFTILLSIVYYRLNIIQIIKRIHDIGYSSQYIIIGISLLLLIRIAILFSGVSGILEGLGYSIEWGLYIGFILLCLIPGVPGTNKYGKSFGFYTD